MLRWIVIGIALLVLLPSDSLFAHEEDIRCVWLEIKGMSCAKCVPKADKALEEVEGVKEATVDLNKGEAMVCIEYGKVSDSDLMRAIEKVGFKASLPEDE